MNPTNPTSTMETWFPKARPFQNNVGVLWIILRATRDRFDELSNLDGHEVAYEYRTAASAIQAAMDALDDLIHAQHAKSAPTPGAGA